MNKSVENVSFKSDGQTIRADLLGSKPNAPCVVMSHGFEASKDGKKWSFLAPKLAEHGYGVLKFNYRGCGTKPGASDGKFEDTTLSARISDYQAALDYIATTTMDQNRIAVIGSSFGGEVPIAAQDTRVKVLVLIATPSRVAVPTEDEFKECQQTGYFSLPSGKRLRMAYFEDASQYDLRKAVGNLKNAKLIIHGDLDHDVPVKQAKELYQYAQEPKRLEIISGGQHALRRKKDMGSILELILEWLHLHL